MNKILPVSTKSYIVALLLGFTFVLPSSAGRYPDTVWLKVTFYDFKADGSNPNFEACIPGKQPNMIQNYLDVWRKPVFKTNNACNDRLGEWFRVSGLNGPDTPSTQFVFDASKKEWKWTGLVNYAPGGTIRPREWVAPHFNGSYAMADIVMFDSLPFRLVDTIRGMYEYNNQTFFRLDGKGWGNQPSGSGHNFGFTMEIHTFFTYTGGEIFRFTGDDDVWAFINGQLAMDIGGVHVAKSDSIILDNEAARLNLEIGKTYPFDFFYAERHTTASTIRITTDLFKPRPSKIIVRPDTLSINPRDTTLDLSDTTITAGQCIKFKLHILDDTLGLRPELDSLIQWEILDTMGNVISFDTVSDTNRICVVKAYGCIKIRLTFHDPEDATNIIRDSVQLCVQHGAANHLLIEDSPLLGASPRNDNPLASLTIPATTTQDTVYAVLRDAYGNFVSPSQNTQWSVISGSSIVSVAGGAASQGAGIISKIGPPGEAWIMARSTDFSGAKFCDTLHVIVSEIAYDSLRIVTGEGGKKAKINSLVIHIGQDSLLKVEGHRVDGLGDHGWQAVSGTWIMSASLRSQILPPGSDSIWNFTPTDTGTGTISVKWGVLTSSLSVSVRPGIASSIITYPNEGKPGALYGNTPYLSSVTYRYQAGSVIPLVAKLFDPINVWLSDYETNPAFGSLFSWEIKDSATGTFIPAMGTLSALSGPKSSFTPFMAFRTYYVTATFSQGAVRLQYTVRFNVTPGTPARLFIEANPDIASSPNANNPVGKIELQSAQTSQPVYAVIRDIYGNYVGHADSALWASRDTQVVTAHTGPRINLGEATVTRIATAASQTWVAAHLGALADSIDVRVTDITYDAVKIMVNSNGLKNVDTLHLRTDQDTTLYALGLRSDTKNWVDVSVAWQTTGVATKPPAPSAANVFTFVPVSPSSGRIIISRTGTGGITVRDSVAVVFLPGLATRLELYSKPGQPLPANKYPDPTVNDTVFAGDSVPLYAKIFDQNSIWLSNYEKNPSDITWRIQELAGNPPTGTLLTSQGYFTVYTPTRAYNTVNVIAEMTINGGVISDMVKIYVKPAPANHVVIEASPDRIASPNANNPIGVITFGPSDTVRYAYGVLRDVFGNYSGAFLQGLWNSLDTALIKTAPGFTKNGEGMMIRNGKAGDTRVLVHSTDFSLSDTVQVRLNNIMYDSLRITMNDTAGINLLTMRIDQDTTLWVQGRRSDTKKWEYVPANWILTGPVTSNPPAPQSSMNWTFSPQDTGSGLIIVTMGTSVPDTVRFTVKFGLPMHLALFPGDNRPDRTTPLPGPQTAIAVAAGETFTITARVLDEHNYWLSEFATVSAPIRWSVEQLSGNLPTDSLGNVAGYACSFSSVRAYNRVYVIAKFELGAKIFFDTIQIAVGPGPAHHLVIEPNPNWQVSPNRDNPADSVTLHSNESSLKVYAVVRDKNGNFINYSTHTSWMTLDTSVCRIEDGITGVGEGVVRRGGGTGNRTFAVAQNQENPTLIDSVIVNLVSYYYEKLRIVVGDSVDIGTLNMSTNDDTTLKVMGLRSDTKKWEYTSARWETSGQLFMAPTAPEIAQGWTFYPLLAGSGILRVTTGKDSMTVPDTLQAAFVTGPPLSVQIDLITPPEKRIAGDTMLAVVRIKNRPGLMPGRYCFPLGSTQGAAVYQTLLGSGTKPPSVIIIDDVSGPLNNFPKDSIKNDECFEGGLDTVKIVLYNAPFTKDSMQQIFATMGALKTATDPFSLLPAGLNSIALHDYSGRMLPDTVQIRSPSGYQGVMAIGFDRFGNKRGVEPGNWLTTGTLHEIANRAKVSRIYYESANVKDNEEGLIIVVAVDTVGGIRRDSVYVRIKGPTAQLVSATTKDVSGNGYLDRIVLVFSKKVLMQRNASIDITYDNTVFTVDSTDRAPDDSNTVFTLYLAEQQTVQPQSAWRPYITIRGIEDMDATDSTRCADGAGPVVWYVDKSITNLRNREQDLVTVTFSEPIQTAKGNALSASLAPGLIFNVWARSESDTTKITGFLDGITSMFKIVDAKTVQFYMNNGNDLTDRHLLNLRTDSAAVADASPQTNQPVTMNRRVAVKVITEFPELMQSAPNPTKPTLRQEPPGTLHLAHNPLARFWIRTEQAGVLMTFKIMPDSGSYPKLRGKLVIYDALGNLVNYDDKLAENDNIIPVEWQSGATTVRDVDIYWNGTNKKGMIVAPGVYRVFLFLETSSHKRRLSSTIGITR
jgi:fibro-slime domain-containing protein